MKRDMELIRQILLAVEASDPLAESPLPLQIPDVNNRILACHVELLVEAGLLRAHIISTEQSGPIEATIERLTWAGHEFLDAARNETVWRKALTLVRDKSGSVSFELLKLYLVAQGKAMLGLP